MAGAACFAARKGLGELFSKEGLVLVAIKGVGGQETYPSVFTLRTFMKSLDDTSVNKACAPVMPALAKMTSNRA